jgi:hypothetical protein
VNMNCNHHRDTIRALGYRDDQLDATSREHLDACELCRAWYREDLLQAALAAQPVPDPSAGFVDRVLANAVSAAPAQHRPTRRNWAAAAVFAVAVTGTFITFGLRESPLEEMSQVAQREARVVNVVIDASDRREDATLTIRLAEDLELEGYAGLHVIEFQTDLERGRNLLALPVRSKTGAGGEIWIALSHDGGNEKTMRIHVNAG